MQLGISQPPHSPIAELSLPLEVVTSALHGECSLYWGQASSRKQSRCGLSKILKLQATFLYSIYHQQAGKTNLFHVRGGRFHVFNILDVPLKLDSDCRIYVNTHYMHTVRN